MGCGMEDWREDNQLKILFKLIIFIFYGTVHGIFENFQELLQLKDVSESMAVEKYQINIIKY